jgi:hypothetical protein
MEQVHLIGAIYIKPLVLHEPRTKELNFFEQEHKNKELKVTFIFLKRTTTSITTLESRVIVISNLEEKVEIVFQPIVEEQTTQALKSKLVEEEVEL